MEFDMKTKLGLIIALGLGFTSASAFAYERQYNHDENRGTFRVAHGGDRLDWQINRMNRMLAHVRWELTRYRGDWRLRREVSRISSEVNRVNWRHRHGWDSYRLRREVERLRAELHNIELRLHVRSGDWYRWQ